MQSKGSKCENDNLLMEQFQYFPWQQYQYIPCQQYSATNGILIQNSLGFIIITV